VLVKDGFIVAIVNLNRSFNSFYAPIICAVCKGITIHIAGRIYFNSNFLVTGSLKNIVHIAIAINAVPRMETIIFASRIYDYIICNKPFVFVATPAIICPAFFFFAETVPVLVDTSYIKVSNACMSKRLKRFNLIDMTASGTSVKLEAIFGTSGMLSHYRIRAVCMFSKFKLVLLSLAATIDTFNYFVTSLGAGGRNVFNNRRAVKNANFGNKYPVAPAPYIKLNVASRNRIISFSSISHCLKRGNIDIVIRRAYRSSYAPIHAIFRNVYAVSPRKLNSPAAAKEICGELGNVVVNSAKVNSDLERTNKTSPSSVRRISCAGSVIGELLAAIGITSIGSKVGSIVLAGCYIFRLESVSESRKNYIFSSFSKSSIGVNNLAFLALPILNVTIFFAGSRNCSNVLKVSALMLGTDGNYLSSAASFAGVFCLAPSVVTGLFENYRNLSPNVFAFNYVNSVTTFAIVSNAALAVFGSASSAFGSPFVAERSNGSSSNFFAAYATSAGVRSSRVGTIGSNAGNQSFFRNFVLAVRLYEIISKNVSTNAALIKSVAPFNAIAFNSFFFNCAGAVVKSVGFTLAGTGSSNFFSSFCESRNRKNGNYHHDDEQYSQNLLFHGISFPN